MRKTCAIWYNFPYPHLLTCLDQFFWHAEFRSLKLRCLKEEGSFKVPVRLQPDADIWDIRVEWTRIRNKSSILPFKGHPLTSKGSSEHCSCCLGGTDWKRREARRKLGYLNQDHIIPYHNAHNKAAPLALLHTRPWP